ncbi:GGDEF domain-containing protein [Sphingoaurantiacus capsulatus]|uniref:diguanylate cyclase n=1 Tax=Sphingoaurantiacus capsulatus TaxID=1771310 RepID=A0ABV7X8J3_9SPHN
MAERIITTGAPPADLYRIIAENVCDGVLYVGLGDTCQYASPSVEEIIGRSPGSMIGVGLLSIIHPEDLPEVERHCIELLERRRDRFTIEFRAQHSNGRWVWLEASARAVPDGDKRSAVTSVRDIRWRKQLEDQLLEALNEAEEKAQALERLANSDPLTGLANRRRFMIELEKAARRASTLAICDIDHFKVINDQHGHQAGDEALRGFAAAAQASFPDALVARIGGEEFAVLMTDTPVEDSVARCDAFLAGLARDGCTLPSGERLALTASIGIAATPCLDASELMQRADRLLYAAKRTGRNRVACEQPEEQRAVA